MLTASRFQNERAEGRSIMFDDIARGTALDLSACGRSTGVAALRWTSRSMLPCNKWRFPSQMYSLAKPVFLLKAEAWGGGRPTLLLPGV